MAEGNAVARQRESARLRIMELEQRLDAIRSVLRAAGFDGSTALELATDAAERATRRRTASDLRSLAHREVW